MPDMFRSWGAAPLAAPVPTVPHLDFPAMMNGLLGAFAPHPARDQGFDVVGASRAGAAHALGSLALPWVGAPNPGPVQTKTPKNASELAMYGLDGKPHGRDVVQDDINDCYFVGAEAAVADMSGGLISNMIHPGKDGGYVVNLYDKSGSKRDVKVSSADVQALLNHHPDQEVLWPVVLEAAQARIEGGAPGNPIQFGIDSLDETGLPGTGLQALTGHSDTLLFPNAGSDLTKTMGLVNSGTPVVMATWKSMTPLGLDPHRDGLVSAHVYEVMSMHKDPDGTVWGLVNNPWGHNRSHGNKGDWDVPAVSDVPGSKWVNLTQAIDHGGIASFATAGSF
ncbi:C2 family cysteine protease [Nocardia sp. NPDC058058]|uniref:C2 family cysteine protease n=1 Tax=Nocardia sp. NPDC058058 TaxID=3346317 RepID=UPI0036DCCE38